MGGHIISSVAIILLTTREIVWQSRLSENSAFRFHHNGVLRYCGVAAYKLLYLALSLKQSIVFVQPEGNVNQKMK
jgi:hypothetical protein